MLGANAGLREVLGPNTIPLCLCALSPQPTSAASLQPPGLSLPALSLYSSSISCPWCGVFHRGALSALDKRSHLWKSENDHSQHLSSLLLCSQRPTPLMAPEAPGWSQPCCPSTLARAHCDDTVLGHQSLGYRTLRPKLVKRGTLGPTFSGVTSTVTLVL